MIVSMTGFGKGEIQWNDYSFSMEVRCLNSKTTDINYRTVPLWRSKELEVRQFLQQHLHRGKIDFFLNLTANNLKSTNTINKGLAKAYITQARDLAREEGLNEEGILTAILKLQDIFVSEEVEFTDEDWNQIEKQMLVVINQVKKFRQIEGDNLQKDLLERCDVIEDRMEKVVKMEKMRSEDKFKKIETKLAEYSVNDSIDRNRLEQEMIYYLEKIDINEEVSRLKSHIDQFRSEVNDTKEVKGKRLSFIGQEMGREINTLGAKAYHSEIQKQVIDMKDELEKIKEQLMNVV